MHLLYLVVELGPLKHLEGVAEDVEDLVRLDLGVPALHEALVADCRLALEAALLRVEALHLLLPLTLDDLNDVRLDLVRSRHEGLRDSRLGPLQVDHGAIYNLFLGVLQYEVFAANVRLSGRAASEAQKPLFLLSSRLPAYLLAVGLTLGQHWLRLCWDGQLELL